MFGALQEMRVLGSRLLAAFWLHSIDLMINRVRERFKRSAPEFVNWLDNNIEEGLTVHAFPRAHQQRLRTTNGLERVNRELKRRTRVAVMFPNMESALRLATGVLVEIHEDWITGKRYLDLAKPDRLAQEKERQVA
jgi:transposase-like protein